MPPQLLDPKVDFTSPGIWFFFVSILILLPYWYFHESAEVQREYSRLYRELAKEDSLKAVADGWDDQFRNATAFYSGGVWFAISWGIVLVLVCGLIFLHGAQDDNIRRVLVFTNSQAEAETFKTDLKMRLPKEHFEMCGVHPADQAAAELRKVGFSPVFGDLPKNAPNLSALVESHIQEFWPKRVGDEVTDARYAKDVALLDYDGATPELRGLKADYVLETTVEHVFRERTACILTDGATWERDRNRVIACVHAGWQRRKAQRWIGGLYLGFSVFCVLFIKGQKSKAFGRMQRFSVSAASAALREHRERHTATDYEI